MSAPTSLLPADAGRTGVDVAVRWGPARDLDRLHDHVLRLIGDEATAARVVVDVATRAAARADELGQALSFERLVQLAHARMAVVEPRQPSEALVARLAGDQEPAGAALVHALMVQGRRGAALLDLTTRHELDLRRAASLIDVGEGAAGARTETLRQVRSHLAADGLALDVEGTLARLPVVGAPGAVHQLVDLPDDADTPGRVPTSLAWLGTAAAVVLTVAGVTFGLPRLVAATPADGAPVVVAEEVGDTPAARKLATPGDDAHDGGVEQLVVREPDEEPVAPSSEDAAPEPSAAPSREPTPTADPTPAPEEEPGDEQPPEDEPSPEPSPEPNDGPIELPLPTSP